jgi:hypothetical protein
MKRFALGLGLMLAVSFAMLASLTGGSNRNGAAALAANAQPVESVYSMRWTTGGKLEYLTNNGLVVRVHQLDPATGKITEVGTMMDTNELAAYEQAAHLVDAKPTENYQVGNRIYTTNGGLVLNSLDSETVVHTYLPGSNITVPGLCPLVSPSGNAFTTQVEGAINLYTGSGTLITALPSTQMAQFSPDGNYFSYSPGGGTPKVIALTPSTRSSDV